MREIKFRAWHKTYKDEYGKQMFEVQGFHTSRKHKEYVNLKGADSIVQLWDWSGSVRMEEVELMQYTGLKDKDGREIYEGDIVRLTNGVIAEVEDIRTFWTIYLTKHEGKTAIEVIGNIYKNPKLLTPPPLAD